LGTYLPVLLVIPLAGTRLAALFFGVTLLLVGLGGLWQTGRRQGLFGLALLILLAPFAIAWIGGPIKDYPGQIFETESAYNYIQVIRQGNCNYLLLNEGQAYHSFYCDGGRVPRISVWSIMLAAPYFNDVEGDPQVDNMAAIGLAAGTIPKQYSQVYGPLSIDGIEIDPAIVKAGRQYFDMSEPNLNVIVGDGRYELNQLDQRYDVITLDAYKVPYIPWHLTTQEFFEEVKARLTDSGVLAINVGRGPGDRRLIDAVTATLLTVFPSVHTVNVPGAYNSIIVATMKPTDSQNLYDSLENMDDQTPALLRAAVETAADNLVPTKASDLIFTDQRAPVETIIDAIVIRYLLEEGPAGLPGLSG
jgi:spermidine synthase